MIVILDLDKQTLAYKNNEPFIQGEDTRNVLQVAVPYSEVTSSFDIQIAYQLQNGRSTIKMANSGVDEDTLTIDGVVHALINFNIPRIATSLSGNLLMTLIVNTSDNKLYKFNALNVVLSRVEFEEWEEAFADSTLLESIQAMESSITALQTAVANRVINGVNPTAIDISSTAVGSANMLLYKLSGDATFASYSERINLEGTNYATIKGYHTLDLIGLDKAILCGDYYSFEVHSSDSRKGFEFWDEQDDRALLVKIDESGVKSNVPYYYNNELMATQSYVNSKAYGNSVSLSGASGTLTDEQLTILTTYKDPVIYYTDSLGVVYSLQLKQKYQNEYVFTLDVSTIVPNYVSVVRYSIKVYTNTKFWVFETSNNDVAAKAYVDTVKNNLQNDINASGHSLVLTIDNDFKLTAILKDANNNTISTSNVIDLPLESVVVNGRYDSATKKVILTLEDGSTIEFSVADLVSGLQSEITAQNMISSDLVDDDNAINKFVTQAEKNYWNSKFDADLLADTETTEIISWGTEDPAHIEPHVGVQVKQSYIDSLFLSTSERQDIIDDVMEVFA